MGLIFVRNNKIKIHFSGNKTEWGQKGPVYTFDNIMDFQYTPIIPRGSIMILGLQHVAITVSNFERAVNFYRDILGLAYMGSRKFSGKQAETILQVTNCNVKVGWFQIGTSGLEIFNFTNIDGSPLAKHYYPDIGIKHFCIRVKDFDTIYNSLYEKGVEFLFPPQKVFGMKMVYCFDPDGMMIELAELIPGLTEVATAVGKVKGFLQKIF